MCVLLGVFREFPVDPYYEPLAWFMIIIMCDLIIFVFNSLANNHTEKHAQMLAVFFRKTHHDVIRFA